ncbi:carbohydrate esterase family 4 protein [Mycena alexandri]|uniref:Carbohydrate esterase family 4 protein n=1 Tax=Mycena alexandri TaxID=1745969 RepID=A0AAD6XA26_9AGAR|nr:carbohydrate esterase family 4 protein [Mycena alexandri]
MLTAVLLAAFAGLGSALTFTSRDGAADDGVYDYHAQIADLLSSYNVKGTFFVNGDNWACIYDKNRMANLTHSYGLGHQIAHHTWSHPDLTTLTATQLTFQLTKMTEAFQRILGVNPAWCRPPYGNYNDTVVNAITAQGMNTVTWNTDSMDSDGYNLTQSEAEYDQLLPSTDGSVIALNHETNPTTASTLIEWLIKKLLSFNYTLVTVAECAGGQPYQSVGQPQNLTADWYCPPQ